MRVSDYDFKIRPSIPQSVQDVCYNYVTSGNARFAVGAVQLPRCTELRARLVPVPEVLTG